MTIKKDLIKFISTAGKLSERELDDETEIYSSGIISSLSLLELMSYIENRYNVIIQPEQLIEDNFKDIKTLTVFVEALMSVEA